MHAVIKTFFHVIPAQQYLAKNFILLMLTVGIIIGFVSLTMSCLFGLGFNRWASFLGISGTLLNIAVTYCAANLWEQGLYSLVWGAVTGSVYLFLSSLLLLLSKNIRFSSLYALLDTYASRGLFDLGCVRLASNTGMALRWQHIEMLKRLFPAAEYFSMYGLTECKRCTYLPPADLERKPDSVGIAIPNMQIMVIDEHGQPCPEGVVGQLIIRERKVIFSEIEKALYLHDGILEAAVVVRTSEGEAESDIIAFYATQDGQPINEFELKRFCGGILEHYQIPQVFLHMRNLPKNANGKFDKRQLRERYQEKLQGNAV